MFCVRALEASHLQRGRVDARLRRARDRTQSRRRSGGAVRQRAAVGRGVPRPPASCLAGRAGIRAQGQAARTAGRARARGVLRAHRHRLHRRGVPDGGRQPAPRVQGGAERDRGTVAGLQGIVPVRFPRPRPGALRVGRRWRNRRRSSARATSAARRPPATSARSAGSKREPSREPGVRGGRPRPPRRPQAAPPPHHAGRRRAVPHARRDRRPRRVDRVRRRHHGAYREGRPPGRGAADARRVRARDAARRTGHLSEGSRPDHHARRHLPGRARARVGDRFGRAHFGAAACDGSGRSGDRLRAPGRLRGPRGPERTRVPRRGCAARRAHP